MKRKIIVTTSCWSCDA